MVLFRHVTLIDPGGPHNGRKADVLLEGGVITSILDAGECSEAVEQVYEGGHLSPGWVDMRVHLTDPGFEWKDRLEDLMASAIAGGFTAFAGLPNTFPVLDNSGLIRSLVLRAQDFPIRFLPYGALSQGAEGKELAELYDMQTAGAVAFTDGHKPVASTGLLLRGLQYLLPSNGLLMSFPLDRSIAPLAEVAEGKVATIMGLQGIPAMAEAMMVERDLQLLGYFPHRLHIGPVTTAASIAILREKKAAHPGLSIETTALHLLLDDAVLLDFDENAKVFPPLRDHKSVEALRAGVVDGTIDVISSSHQPQGTEEKVHDFLNAAFGALMLETSFAAARTALGETALEKLIACISTNPRRILGLEAAHIVENELAEMTHFDPDEEWMVTPADFKSRSRNSPLIGKTLRGRPLGVLVDGMYMPR